MPHCSSSMRIRDIDLRAFDGPAPPESTDEVVYLNKPPDLLARLDAVVARVAPTRMVEVGIFHGGSGIYWEYRHRLERLTLLDSRPDAPPFERYLRRHGLEGTVRAHFGVSQDDRNTVRRIVTDDMGGAALDLVIDDASHMYAPTLATFECLFPMVRPAGAYIIEDWAWGHWPGWEHIWPEFPLMSPLIVEAMLACARRTGIIDQVDVNSDYAVVWRGPEQLAQDGSFRLKDHYFARDFALPPVNFSA